MNIILIGLMGSGKSAVGRLLAERLGRPFIDTDALIEAAAGMTIPAIFASEGEAGFRDREQAMIAAVTAQDGQVIATGGGAVIRPANRAALREGGLVIWLDAPPEALLHRAKAQGVERRPLLAGGDPLERLREMARNRLEAYRETAHLRVETDYRTLPDVLAEVAALVEREENLRG